MRHKHTHQFTQRTPTSTVATCSCGSFRHTEHNHSPVIVNVPTPTAFYAESLNRAINALLVELTDEQIDLCAADLAEIERTESHPDSDAVLSVWLTRIGGWRNVSAYARTLQAGAMRRAARR